MRSPLAALRRTATEVPIPYVSDRRNATLPGMFANNGIEAQMRAMGSVGTLFSIVHRTSVSTSAVEWKLYRKPKAAGRRRYAGGAQKAEERVEVTSHAALDLWNRPNPWMHRQEFVESEQQHIDLTGEGWWVISRVAGSKLPLELWPVRPDRIRPVPHPTKFLTGYIYSGPGGEEVPLELDDVIQIRMPNPLDVYRGMGPVQAVLADLDASKYSAEWNRNFFLNSAQPGGIIQVDKRLSDDEFRDMVTRWREQHQGVAQAHRVAILEQGQWIDRKFSLQDMQFVQLREVARDTIREAFGIPKFALGDIDDVNRATAEASKAWFAEQLTVPRLERFKLALNNELLPMFGSTAEGLEFDYVSPVPEDREVEAEQLTARSNAAKTLVTSGYDPAEVLETVGLPPMKFVGIPSGVPASPEPAPEQVVQDVLAEARERFAAT